MRLREPHPHSLSPRALAIAGWSAFALAGAIFLALAWSVAGRSAVVGFDAQLSAWLEAHQHRALTPLLLAITHLNSNLAISAYSAVFALALARLREWYWCFTLALAVPGGLVLNALLKAVYERVRPRFAEPALSLDTFSFPSGHTAGAVVFYGVLAAFLVSRFYGWRERAACVALAIGAVALVAFSRLYLGAHFLSDVLAAACASTAWLVLCLAAGHALVKRRLKPRWALAALMLVCASFGAALLPLADWSHRLQDALEAMGVLQGLLIFLAANVVATLLLVPAWIFPLVAGAAFGPLWGFAVACAAALASALIAFLLARHVARRRFEQLARRHPRFKAIDQAVAREGWRVVALLRMSPLLPSGLKSYFLGITRVRLGTYAIASLAGMLPGLLLKVYLGHAGRAALVQRDAWSWTLLALGIAATLALTFLVSRKWGQSPIFRAAKSSGRE